MNVDQRIVAKNLRVMRRDEPHASHVGGERIHLVDSVGGFQAVFPTTQIQLRKIVSCARLIFGVFQIRAAYPVALFLEITHQMVADEATSSRNQDSLHSVLPSGVRQNPPPRARYNATGGPTIADFHSF